MGARILRQIFLLLGFTVAALLGWMARGWYLVEVPMPTAAPRARPPSAIARPAVTVPVPKASTLPPIKPAELPVPVEVLAPIATVTATMAPSVQLDERAPSTHDPEAPRPLIVPVAGVARSSVRDMFDEGRGDHRHEAIDIMAPRGTPVLAADDGVVAKIWTSKAGGLTVYVFDPDERFCYYYAHLDRYAAGLREGQRVRRGDVIAYVGSTGNAAPDAPHLHFALIRLDSDKRWWKGTYVNPYPLLMETRKP
ncbi:MAG: M23 family metallopeptidase [Thermoanaerobaculia bacterium]